MGNCSVVFRAYLEAAHSLDVSNRQHHREKRVQALIDDPHAVHKLGDPGAVAAVVVLEGDGADSTGDGVQHHQQHHNGQLLIIFEHHGRWENDCAHQLAPPACHA